MKKIIFTFLLTLLFTNANAADTPVNYAFDFNQITIAQFIDFYLKLDKKDSYFISEPVSNLTEKFTLKKSFSSRNEAETFFQNLLSAKSITVNQKQGITYYDLKIKPESKSLDIIQPFTTPSIDDKTSLLDTTKQKFSSTYLLTLLNTDSASVIPFLPSENCRFLTNVSRPDLVTLECKDDQELENAKRFITVLDKPLQTGELKLGFYQVNLSKDDMRNFGGAITFLSNQLTAVIGSPATTVGSSALKLTTGNFNLATYFSKSKSSFSTLSEPYAFLTNGQALSFSSGSQVPVLQSTVSATANTPLQTQIKYVNTGLVVSVTPTFLGENKVKLLLNFNVSTAVKNQVSGIDSPSIDNKSITSTYILERGTTLLVSGLSELSHSKSDTSFLGVVPLGKTTSQSNSDILFTLSLN